MWSLWIRVFVILVFLKRGIRIEILGRWIGCFCVFFLRVGVVCLLVVKVMYFIVILIKRKFMVNRISRLILNFGVM